MIAMHGTNINIKTEINDAYDRGYADGRKDTEAALKEANKILLQETIRKERTRCIKITDLLIDTGGVINIGKVDIKKIYKSIVG